MRLRLRVCSSFHCRAPAQLGGPNHVVWSTVSLALLSPRRRTAVLCAQEARAGGRVTQATTNHSGEEQEGSIAARRGPCARSQELHQEHSAVCSCRWDGSRSWGRLCAWQAGPAHQYMPEILLRALGWTCPHNQTTEPCGVRAHRQCCHLLEGFPARSNIRW